MPNSCEFSYNSRKSESVSDFNLLVFDRWNWHRLDDRLIVHLALVPWRNRVRLVVSLDVLPIGRDEIAVPLVQVGDSDLPDELHAEAGRLVFVVVQHTHEYGLVGRVLERGQFRFQRRGRPLDAMTKQVQKNKTL